MIERRVRLQPQLIADDLKHSGRIIGDGDRRRIRKIRIDGGEAADDGACGVFKNSIRRQQNVCRGLVNVSHRKRDGLLIRVAGAVGHRKRKRMSVLRLKVGRSAGLQLQLAPGDFEQA